MQQGEQGALMLLWQQTDLFWRWHDDHRNMGGRERHYKCQVSANSGARATCWPLRSAEASFQEPLLRELTLHRYRLKKSAST